MDKLRAWWAHRQGLDGTLAGLAADEVLARTGWARSVGGSAPYLGLFARSGLDREAVDLAVARLEVHELPSARGCTYVLPAADFALGLTVGATATERDVAAAEKLGVSRREVDDLCSAVLDALGTDEPLDPTAIKQATGGAVRNLGEAGRRRGLSTTLPLALGLLQAGGRVRRVPVGGRLDQQRYGYVRWSPSPMDDAEPDAGTARVELARRYFDWAGPASVRHFRWFSGFTSAQAKQAVEPLDLVPVTDSELLLPSGQAAGFADFVVPTEPCYTLVAAIDGIHLLHRDLGRLLDPVDQARPQPGSANRTLADEPDPQTALIVDRGRVVGLWEYDPDAGKIVYQAFVPADPAMRAAVARTEEFAREQLGDVRGFSLDSPKSRAPRLAALRAGD